MTRRGGVRILVDVELVELDLADPYGVCVGLVKPNRRAWWQLVSTWPTQRQAEQAMAELDPYRGRALLNLAHPDIVAVDLAGEALAVSS